MRAPQVIPVSATLCLINVNILAYILIISRLIRLLPNSYPLKYPLTMVVMSALYIAQVRSISYLPKASCKAVQELTVTDAGSLQSTAKTAVFVDGLSSP